MKVKIGNTWYDSMHEPICVELTDKDKENIQNMLPESKKYACFPDSWDGKPKSKLREWMK
jgi:hypothetical protein